MDAGWMIGGLSILGLAFLTSGCGVTAHVPREGIVIAGTPEGIRAFGEMQNGLITNTRNSPDQKSAYWQQREQLEVEMTKRETAPGFFDKLMGRQ